jgi:hypothetical protein
MFGRAKPNKSFAVSTTKRRSIESWRVAKFPAGSMTCCFASTAIVVFAYEEVRPDLLGMISTQCSFLCGSLGSSFKRMTLLVLFGGALFRGSSSIRWDDGLLLLMNNLPLEQDKDEAKICHAGLYDK